MVAVQSLEYSSKDFLTAIKHSCTWLKTCLELSKAAGMVLFPEHQ